MASSSSPASGIMSRSKRKSVNLLDHVSVKRALDESVNEVVTSKGYAEDVRMHNLRLLIGFAGIAVALAAQFYSTDKFPQNRSFLLVCIILIFKYLLSRGFLLLVSFYLKDKNVILFTRPLSGSFNSTGLIIASKLPRFSETYTLMISGTEPKSASAKRPVQLTKSVTKWFTKDGVLVEGLLWKDVERLMGDYSRGPKMSEMP